MFHKVFSLNYIYKWKLPRALFSWSKTWIYNLQIEPGHQRMWESAQTFTRWAEALKIWFCWTLSRLTGSRQHWIHTKAKFPEAAGFNMLYFANISNMTKKPGQICVVTYSWTVTDNCYMLARPCYCNIHSPVVSQKANCPQIVWSNLGIIKQRHISN